MSQIIKSRTPVWLLALVLILAPSITPASEGVLEINQTCAVAMGCFPGDTPGFPVTISSPGAYALTGGLVGPIALTIIDIQASGVDLNLNGHHVSADGLPYNRTSVSGIRSSTSQSLVKVRNGFITNTTIALSGGGSEIRNIRSEVLISCGRDCAVIDSKIATRWDDSALVCGSGCQVIRSSIYSDEAGLTCGHRCRIESSVIRGDESGTLSAGDDTQILDSILMLDFSPHGCGERCLIRNTTITGGASVFSPFVVGAHSRLQGVILNSVYLQLGNGTILSDSVINIESVSTVVLDIPTGTARYADSMLSASGGAPTVTGNIINGGGNVCNGSVNCP